MTATDADDGVNSQIKYSIIGGTDRDHFKIDEDSGFINTATKLDYETKKSYLLTVQGILKVPSILKYFPKGSNRSQFFLLI